MRLRGPLLTCCTQCAVLLAASAAHADDELRPPEPSPSAPSTTPGQPLRLETAPAPQPEESSAKSGAPRVTPLGYVEAYYAYNLNRPSNGITNVRGFDNRHDSFTLSNAVLGATWEAGPVGGKLTLQVGAQGATYYQSEPTRNGTPGANASTPELWKYVQEAFVTYKAPLGSGLLLQLGLCASPVGLESMAVKDNWNWSRANLFFGLPFYHTGLRATYEWTHEWSTTVSVFNGWNSIVDNNEEKSVEGQVNYKDARWQLQALYFGGVERSTGAPEGPWWRHHFDATAQVDATKFLSFAAEGDAGWEPNRFGTATWWGAAAYARVEPVHHVYVAFRGDRLAEHLAADASGTSSSLFFGGPRWVTSGTMTLEVRPHDQISIRLEGRHDLAQAPLFFKSTVQGDGSGAAPYIANARAQTTLLLGATAWF
jgi:hypothetical protein